MSTEEADKKILRTFAGLPGVGDKISRYLWEMGYRNLDEIARDDPESMYAAMEKLKGSHVDRCMLYVFRCIHYHLNTGNPNPELEKWWNWQD